MTWSPRQARRRHGRRDTRGDSQRSTLGCGDSKGWHWPTDLTNPSDRYDSIGIARDDILEFQKMLDTLNIELAGIRVRLETIEKYKSASTSDSYRQKLQEMAIEQTIELSGAEAKKKEVLSLLSAAKDYYDAIANLDKIKTEINYLEAKQKTIDEQRNYVEKMISGSIYSFEIEPIT